MERPAAREGGRSVDDNSSHEEDESFEEAWSRVDSALKAYCTTEMRDRDLAEDLYQDVAIKAFAKYDSFLGASSFLTWVMAIARRMAQRKKERKMKLVWREAPHNPEFIERLPAPESAKPEPLLLEGRKMMPLIEGALKAGFLDQDEAHVIRLRLECDDESWDQIGRRLGVRGNTCAQCHSRAMPKILVYLFIHCADLLGGVSRIRDHWRSCVQMGDLAPDESEAFRQIVLLKSMDYKRAGWVTSLRSACGKVMRSMRWTTHRSIRGIEKGKEGSE